jgi:hypothetical protein
MSILRVLLVSFVVFAGCKKKEETPAAGSAMGSGSDTGSAMGSAAGSADTMAGSGSGSGSAMAGSGSDMGSAAGSAATGSGSGSAVAAAVEPIKDDKDYEARDTAAMDKMLAVFAAAGKDCKKLAKDLNAYFDENAGLQKEIATYEKAHPAARKALGKKMKAREKEMMAKMKPALEACGEDKDFLAAMERMK